MDLNIRNVPEELMQAVRVRAAREGVTIRDLALRALKNAIIESGNAKGEKDGAIERRAGRVGKASDSVTRETTERNNFPGSGSRTSGKLDDSTQQRDSAHGKEIGKMLSNSEAQRAMREARYGK